MCLRVMRQLSQFCPLQAWWAPGKFLCRLWGPQRETISSFSSYLRTSLGPRFVASSSSSLGWDEWTVSRGLEALPFGVPLSLEASPSPQGAVTGTVGNQEATQGLRSQSATSLDCIQHHLERYLPRTPEAHILGCGVSALLWVESRTRQTGGVSGGWWSPSSEEGNATWCSGNISRVIFWLLAPNLWTARSNQSV